jgi:hypothetical protein
LDALARHGNNELNPSFALNVLVVNMSTKEVEPIPSTFVMPIFIRIVMDFQPSTMSKVPIINLDT